jgi:tetratricopeptide (TPR) repeat protein
VLSDSFYWDFFVSYAQADVAWAEWIAWQLEASGHRVLLQAWDMVAGANWVHRMHDGLARASRVVAVLSPQYLASVYGSAEWQAAWQRDPRGERRSLLVVRIAECSRPGLLAGVVSVDLFGVARSVAQARLGKAVRGALAGRLKPADEPAFPPDHAPGRVEPDFPGPAPAIWNVPLRNPNFIGRAAELERIAQRLTGAGVMSVQALHGMGGVGKTQVAVEYAHRHAGEYDLVWWINAEQPELLAGQFAALGIELGLPAAADARAGCVAVCRELRVRGSWLLVFDNAEDVEQVRAVLPGGSGHALVTTRRGGFRALGSVLGLDVLDRTEAVTLLLRHAPALTEGDAAVLAEHLGDLPLALEQAAAYLDQTAMPAGEYLSLLQTRGEDLHTRGHAAGTQNTVATVWSLSIDRLRASAPAAVQLLQLCGWLGAEPIPLDLFTGHADRLPAPLDQATADPLITADVVGALGELSLARRAGSSLQIHRLVQAVARGTGLDRSRLHPLAVALTLLRADVPSDIVNAPQGWPRWRQLLPHVLAATSRHDDATPIAAADTAWLVDRAGTYLQSQREPIAARPLHERALQIQETLYGPDHPDLTTTLNDLGWVLSDLGQPSAAIPLHRRALRIREAAYGPDDPQVATALTNLGRALTDLGKPDQARPLLERALQIRQTIYGPDHPRVATALADLGVALTDLGQPDQARSLLERALQIREATYGPDDRWVALTLTTLARILTDLDDAAAAEPQLRRALQILETAGCPDHPDAAATLTALGRALADQHRPADARPHLERAFQVNEAFFGPDHPRTVRTRDELRRISRSESGN